MNPYCRRIKRLALTQLHPWSNCPISIKGPWQKPPYKCLSYSRRQSEDPFTRRDSSFVFSPIEPVLAFVLPIGVDVFSNCSIIRKTTDEMSQGFGCLEAHLPGTLSSFPIHESHATGCFLASGTWLVSFRMLRPALSHLLSLICSAWMVALTDLSYRASSLNYHMFLGFDCVPLLRIIYQIWTQIALFFWAGVNPNLLTV